MSDCCCTFARTNQKKIESEMMLTPFARPFYMMAKPVGATCNLACRYCYYLDKQQLYAGEDRRVMSDEVLELFVAQYIECQPNREVLFTWHGGEPLLLPQSFYEKAMRLQQRYARGRHIDNCLQTNGTLLTDEWCRFFHDNGWLIGISIDGPEQLHDCNRKNRQGLPSWKQVMQGIERLEKYGVMWNALCTVNSQNAEHPEELYAFFRDRGCQFLQLTPVGGDVTAEQWGRFLCRLFDEWSKADVGRVFVNIFEATLANYMGVTPGICAMSALCGHVGVVEWNGDVYSCDHFVYPQHKLGNLCHQTLCEMMLSEQQQAFARQKHGALPQQCRECQWLFACHGECPRNRTAVTADGEPGLNYLCQGYKTFFEHTESFMKTMRNELNKEER
jgi:uncharacterized protein